MNDQQDFERALRARYIEAGSRLSARTQAQLHHRLHAALARGQRANTRRPMWRLAAACALLLTFAFGLQWRAGNETRSNPASTFVANSSNDSGELVATLDETPDLYLWLASDDAAALASE